MSTDSYIYKNYKLASGAILYFGTYEDSYNDDIEFFNEYFLNDWVAANLEHVPNHEYEYWFPFNKIQEFINAANEALKFSHSYNTSKVLEVFPHIKNMSQYHKEYYGIVEKDGKFTFSKSFFETLSSLCQKLAPVLADAGNSDIIPSFYVC